MLLRIVVAIIITCHSYSYSQTKLLLKNTRSNRQKEIALNDFIKIRFSSAYENVKIFHTGKVVSFTDSTLSYLPVAVFPLFYAKKDTVRVAFKNITAIQKYRPIVNAALLFGVGAGAGVGLAIAEENVSKSAVPAIILVYGALIIYQGIEARLVYPMRKVNQPNSVWQLSISP